MPARLTFSLGGVWPPPPRTCRGTKVIVEAIAVADKNRRRFMLPSEEESGFVFDLVIFIQITKFSPLVEPVIGPDYSNSRSR
jgi:hypothetical protein